MRERAAQGGWIALGLVYGALRFVLLWIVVPLLALWLLDAVGGWFSPTGAFPSS